MLWIRRGVMTCLVVGGIGLLTASMVHLPSDDEKQTKPPVDVSEMVQRLNQHFEARWTGQGLVAANPAEELQVYRRMSLALHGTIPSLQEIREFQGDTRPLRLERWLDRLLQDSRFTDYFGERLARVFVGTDEGQFIVFRRDRLVGWLRDQLSQGTPYDRLVREMIAAEGLWTGEPATNFISAAVANNQIDENKLAGRTVRAFLGQRIDCAQCHDHPFAHWKQAEFEGLAAWYGQVQTTLAGVEERGGEFVVEDRKTLKQRTIAPQVPFLPQCVPAQGSRRQRLADWVTHPDNQRFERATVNRIWGLMFGKPFVAPVDDIPDPTAGTPDVLDLLGRDFRAHGCDLKRLIRVIALSRPFRVDSRHPASMAASSRKGELVEAWGVFPLVRLRPEQVIGSMLQASSLTTIDQNSQLVVRFIRFLREIDFVRNYGDLGENEVADRAGTIPQALLKMNGKLTRELSEANPFSAVGRIAAFGETAHARVEVAYLACLSRLPTSEELQFFSSQFHAAQGGEWRQVVSDLYWSLFNSPEFSWNH